MDEPAPSPSPTQHRVPVRRSTSRRWFLAGGAAVVLGGAGGTSAGFLRHHPSTKHVPPPAELIAAIDAEDALIADLAATTGGPAAVRQLIVQARQDHLEHAQALRAVVALFGAPPAAPGSRSGAGPGGRSTTSGDASASPPGTPRTLAQLRAAEDRAAKSAARLAAQLDGANATLLASIAACEATHAELLG